MAPSKSALALTVAGLLACAGMGAYGTFGAGFNNGLFAAIENSVGHAQPDPYFISGPKPYRLVYTGFEPFDRQLRTLISFFVMLIDGPKTGDVVLVYWYLMAQFCAGWSLLFLEGMRRGNADRAVSWTGVMGLIFQNITYTITVPLYLVLHLFTSPLVAVGPATSDLAAVDAIDSMTFPITSLAAFWGPAVLMALPSPSARVSAAMHYSWNALWQAFPATQGLYRGVLKLAIPQAHDAGIPQSRRLNRQALGYVYGFVALLAAASHLGLLAAALAPASLVPAGYRALVAEVDLLSAFVPHWPGSPPVVAVGAGGARITGAGLPELVKLFLQWDIYCGGAAILIWAVYLHGAAVPGRSLAGLLPKVAVWTLLGGFPAAATVLLWERDWAVFAEDKGKKTQ